MVGGVGGWWGVVGCGGVWWGVVGGGGGWKQIMIPTVHTRQRSGFNHGDSLRGEIERILSKSFWQRCPRSKLHFTARIGHPSFRCRSAPQPDALASSQTCLEAPGNSCP